jgi:hypothetical protein
MLLLRAEGVASSFIEGIQTPLFDVATSEIGGSDNPIARLISDNLAAVVDALATSGSTLKMGDIHDWHRRLLSDDDRHLPAVVGTFRDAQSWIRPNIPTYRQSSDVVFRNTVVCGRLREGLTRTLPCSTSLFSMTAFTPLTRKLSPPSLHVG